MYVVQVVLASLRFLHIMQELIAHHHHQLQEALLQLLYNVAISKIQ